MTSAVPDEVGAGDRHVVAAALASRADVIVTDYVRNFAPDRPAEVGLLVSSVDAPQVVLDELAAMAASTSRPAHTSAQVLESLRRFAPDRGPSG